MSHPPEPAESGGLAEPIPKTISRPKKPPKAVGSVAPAVSPSSAAAEHRRDMERERAAHDRDIACKTLLHQHEQEKQAAAHKRRMDAVMLYSAIGATASGVAVGLCPGLSDDLKKTLIGALALIVSNGFSYVIGKASAKE